MRRSSLLLPLSISFASLAFACTSTIDTGGGGSGGGSSSSSSGMSSSGSSSGTSSSSSSGAVVTCDDPPSPAAFEVGTGEICFERLTSGQEVNVMAGPQGGFHLWLAVGMTDWIAQPIVEFGVQDVSTHAWLTGFGSKTVVTMDGDGWHQRAGFTAFLPGVEWDPSTVLPKGTHVLLVASVLAQDNTVLHTAEVEVVLGDTVTWYPPCDPSSMCGQPGGLPCCTDADGGP